MATEASCACKQGSDSAEELMAAFGNAAALIQQSEFVRCQSEQADADVAFQEDDDAGVCEVDAESLAVAKQVQAELHRAMHAALSTNNGFLIIPTMPGPPIQSRYCIAHIKSSIHVISVCMLSKSACCLSTRSNRKLSSARLTSLKQLDLFVCVCSC